MTRLLECGRQAGGVRQLDRRALKGPFRSIGVKSGLSGSAVVALPCSSALCVDSFGKNGGAATNARAAPSDDEIVRQPPRSVPD
jgi:hypothetical protein